MGEMNWTPEDLDKRNREDTVCVPLSKGYVALIDATDAAHILLTKWCASEHRSRRTGKVDRVYALGRPSGGGRQISMHAYLMGTAGCDVDHRDSNTLNNRRSNLRASSRQQNNANQRKSSGRSSKYKGVSFHKDNRNWTAQITVAGRQRHLGSFCEECDAATAYNFAAVEAFGEFSQLNTI